MVLFLFDLFSLLNLMCFWPFLGFLSLTLNLTFPNGSSLFNFPKIFLTLFHHCKSWEPFILISLLFFFFSYVLLAIVHFILSSSNLSFPNGSSFLNSPKIIFSLFQPCKHWTFSCSLISSPLSLPFTSHIPYLLSHSLIFGHFSSPPGRKRRLLLHRPLEFGVYLAQQDCAVRGRTGSCVEGPDNSSWRIHSSAQDAAYPRFGKAPLPFLHRSSFVIW